MTCNFIACFTTYCKFIWHYNKTLWINCFCNHQTIYRGTQREYISKLLKHSIVQPRSQISHLPAQAREERPWLGLVTCLPESGRWQLNHWREGRPSINFVHTEPTWVRNMLSPKYTRFHVLPRYVVLQQCPTVIFCKRRKKLIHRLITMDTSTRRRRGLNFAVAGDKKDLSLTEKEVRKRKI